MDICRECGKAVQEAHHGIYTADCIGCAVREVKAARCAGKGHQEQIIGHYVKVGRLSRSEIIDALKNKS